VYSEPRGLLASYRWPQYSVHRGALQMLPYGAAVERLGAGAIRTGPAGHRIRRHGDHGVTALIRTHDGSCLEMDGSVLIGVDGLHSAVRAQMHPHQPPIHRGGAIMWRGTTQGRPIRTGASFVGLGTHRQRVVFYHYIN
jgi:2-polyprenyl-6-methoxyphenol hydroxylase-like FAD-dependent oxidoreductase